MAGTPPTSKELAQMVRLGVQEGIAQGMKALAIARDDGPALGASHVLQAMATTLVATQEADHRSWQGAASTSGLRIAATRTATTTGV